MRFVPTELTATETELQAEVRAFLASELPPGSHEPGLGMSAAHNKEFSKKMADRGWVGMSLPVQYGGGDRSAVDRFIVVEEMLRWGAPVGYHWVADRQTGNIILAYGTEDQKDRFLPKICAGELGFSIGMSEPDSGSDLASVSTRAERDNGGWVLNGTKIWTSNAHTNDWFICLVRTSALEPGGNKRHGLSQFLVDLHNTDGLQLNPIPFLNGEHHFNEVSFTDVFVPDDNVVGTPGMGWNQNTTEMAYERGGPDRWLSVFSTIEQLLRETENTELDEPVVELFGELVARWCGIRNMSLSVARLIDDGQAPSIESALVKEMGTRFEIETIEKLVELTDTELSLESSSLFERLLAQCVLTGPGNTIRGGTIEILRSVISKGLQGMPA